MAKIVIGIEKGSYSFDKVAKTITINGFKNITLERFLVITDITNNNIIYNFADNTLGGTLSNNVLTLTYNTNVAGFANTDNLMIVYWDEDPQQVTIQDIADLMTRRDVGFLRRIENDMITGKIVTISNSSIPISIATNSSLAYTGNAQDFYLPFEQHIFLNNNFNNAKNKYLS